MLGKLSADTNYLQLLNAMVVRSHRLIHEGKAAAWQIDMATIFGLGFPCWRGGLLLVVKEGHRALTLVPTIVESASQARQIAVCYQVRASGAQERRRAARISSHSWKVIL